MKPAHKIINVSLDANSVTTRSADIELERHRAISDLLVDSSFRLNAPANAEGPYRLHLKLEGSGLELLVGCVTSGHEERIALPLTILKRHINDYVILCDNFYKTARTGDIHRLEALDAGRRSIHDEAAETLVEALENKVTLDKLTARRLFTLLYVLHMRGDSTL